MAGAVAHRGRLMHVGRRQRTAGDNAGMTVQIVFCTCPDAATADRLAAALVDERLAACVNLLPGLTSIYRWQGRIQREAEVLLLIKTTADRLPALRARLVELHPYELPELVAVEAVAGLPAYLDWVVTETRETPAS